MSEREPEITKLLRAHERGEAGALDEAIRHIYEDLKRLAHRQLGANPKGRVLDTTALVHEAYVRLVDRGGASWNDRRHFIAAAATAMRHVIVDRVRGKLAAKRGAGRRDVTLDDQLRIESGRESGLALEVDEALQRLHRIDPRLVKVIECRFYAGFTAEETGTALGVSSKTVERDWKRARAWLRDELDERRRRG
jgi:RNA polymerase sigma factor (TIGR02999 family)